VKIACIVPRYGAELAAGPELACRLLAEQLASRHDVEVLTTCAQDSVTWKNVHPEGSDRIRGVIVRRFANAAMTDADAFRRLSSRVLPEGARTTRDEQEWVRRQGPWCPALVEFLRRHQRQFDLFLFFSFRHAPTIVGIGAVDPARAVLVPWVTDPTPLVLHACREPFARAAAVIYVSAAEQEIVKLWVPQRSAVEEVLPWGVEAPPPGGLGRRWTDIEERSTDERWPEAGPGSNGVAAHLTERGAEFRRRVRLFDPFVLSTARVTPGDGIEEAFAYFARYVEAGGTATLVLTGDKTMKLPDEPWVRFIGHLSEVDRPAALEAATVVLAPCPSDTLALDALNAMASGTAVLAAAINAAAVEHCRRGNGGLYYADGDEFVACLTLLMEDDRLRNAIGRSGRDYVRRQVQWDVVLGGLDRIVTRIRGGRQAA